jgi:hypothetical protein
VKRAVGAHFGQLNVALEQSPELRRWARRPVTGVRVGTGSVAGSDGYGIG